MVQEPIAGIAIPPLGQERVQAGDPVDYLIPQFTDISELRAGLTWAAVLPLGILRLPDLDAPEAQRLIGPYLNQGVLRRHAEAPDTTPIPYPVTRALIALPPEEGGEARVFLNEEVRVLAKARLKYTTVQAGDPVYLKDLLDLRDLHFEGMDVRRQPFAWLRQSGDGYVLYFSFLANVPNVLQAFAATGVESESAGWSPSPEWQEAHGLLIRSVQDQMAQEVLRSLLEQALPHDDVVRDRMRADGWFPAPCLIPDPWKAMCDAYRRGAPTEATTAAAAALSAAELWRMCEAWVSREPFSGDRSFLERAIEHYLAGDPLSAVSVLLPRIEGLVNRARLLRGMAATSKFDRVFRKVEQLGDAELGQGWLVTRLREGWDEMIGDFFGANFNPSDPAAAAKRGRHPHAHGATGGGRVRRAVCAPDPPHGGRLVLPYHAG